MDNDSPHSPDPEPSSPQAESGIAAFWTELRRRKVVRVAITYAVAAWLIIQIAATTFEGFGIPVWAFRFVMLCVILGFPLALILTWAFELTPDGIKTTRHAREERGSAPVSDKQQRKGNWYTVLFAAAIPTLIFGTLATVFYFQRIPEVSQGLDKSIAVLPFTNMSPDEENAYFADGIHETILTDLANLGDLRVVSRTSVLKFRDSDKTIPEIGEALEVAYILEGSVQRIGDQFRLTTQLIQADNDDHLWAKNYDGEFKDVFAVQSQLSREISNSLKVVLSPEESERLDKKPTDNLEAYELYLKAITLSRTSLEHTQLLQKAVALDPDFTFAWTRLSVACSTRYVTTGERTVDMMNNARDAIRRAYALDPESPEVLLAIGYFNYGCLQEYWIAEHFFREVERKLPHESRVYQFLGLAYRRDNRWREAIENLERAYRLDPGGGPGFLTAVYRSIHDWETSLKYHLISNPEGKARNRILRDFFVEGKKPEYEESNEISLLQKIDFAWQFGQVDAILRLIDQAKLLPELSPYNQFGTISPRSNAWREGIVARIRGDLTKVREIFLPYRDHIKKESEGAPLNYNDLGILGRIESVLGNEEAALIAFEKARTLNPEQRDSWMGVQISIERAICLGWLGYKDEAVAELARLIKIPSNMNVHWMANCPDFWPLRDHPGFQAILNDPANNQPLDLDSL